MELTEKNLLDCIRKEYESLTNENYFAYGFAARSESYYRLVTLRGILLHFNLGDGSRELERNIEDAMKRLKTWCDEHNSWGR